MSEHLIYVDTKNEKIYKSKNDFFFIIRRVILNYIITENKAQCACKLALSFVDLGTSLVQKDSVETESSSLLGSSLEFDFCFCDN